jgi:hypothetical protein
MNCIICNKLLKITAKWGYCEQHSHLRSRKKPKTKFCSVCSSPLREDNKSFLCTKHSNEKWERENRGVGGKKYSQKIEYNRKYYTENKDILNEKCYLYRKNNLEKIREYDRQRSKTPEGKQKFKEYENKRLKLDPQFRLMKYLRNTIYIATKRKLNSKKAVEFLGCSIPEYRKYLETSFKEGMTWENWGKWHIDHIIPLFKFNLQDKKEFLKAAHFTNTQPLWADENYKKRNIEVWGGVL